ncbi:hypothetical protein F8M41_006331 [Gigaspora margarita]|uniref:Uncharacterized protein n=1 Tax=Gigaspora margarita TaxID=4874 RepID=A0A8H4AX22_GIGMA|nr:hypothetical protein F8M41_006331 [Gigaspora margarita]
MNQSTNRYIGAQPQINNGQSQRFQNTNNGGPQTTNGQFQGALNVGVQLPRLQNIANRFNRNFIANQKYSDLLNGTNPFTSMQSIGNLPQEDTQFSTLIFSGISFP